MILSAINLGRYSPGSSLLHRADPRTKVILALLLIAALLTVKSYPSFLLLLIFTLLVTLQAGKSLQHQLLGLRPILWLAAGALLFNLFFIPGTPIAEAGILHCISREGLNFSVRMVLRLILLVTAASLLTLTTTPLALVAGAESLLKPLKRCGLPVHQLTMILVLALRFIPVIVEEGERILKAQSSRSAIFNRGHLRQRLQSFLPLLMPLFVGIFRRGDALATAMESRCYRGDVARTRMQPLRFSSADLICAVVALIFFAVLIFVEVRNF